MTTLTVLGSTGSIGTSTLDVVRHNRESYRIHALVAGTNVDLLLDQIREFEPNIVVVADSHIQDLLAARLHESGRKHLNSVRKA